MIITFPQKSLGAALVFAALAAACANSAVTPTPQITVTVAPTSTAVPPTVTATFGSPGGPIGAMPTLQLTQARSAASADLSRSKGIPLEEIGLYSADRVDWPDSSLGNPQPGYAYSQIVTPGWKLMLFASGQRYEYHTNLDGTAVSYVGSAPLPPGFTPTPQNY